MYDQTRISRFEGAYYAQYRFSYRSCGSSRSHLFVATTGDSRERSNRRWRRRRTYRRCIARWGPGVTPCSAAAAAAGLLCAGTGIRRRARVPVHSRTLLGRLRLGIPPRRGLRLIVRCTDHRLPRKCEERRTRPFEWLLRKRSSLRSSTRPLWPGAIQPAMGSEPDGDAFQRPDRYGSPKPTSAQFRRLVPAEHGRNEASIGSPTS